MNELPHLISSSALKQNLGAFDIGLDEGIMKGTKCVAFREGDDIIHPITHEVLGKKVKKLGEVIVEQVQEKMSIAKIIESEEAIESGDKVVVK